MAYFKRNIILSSVNNLNKDVKGVFTIECNNNSCGGILRIYNLNATGNYCLGILVNGIPLQKTALNSEVVFCKVDLPHNLDINSKIAVIVVENCGTTNTPIVFGTTENSSYNENYNFFAAQDLTGQIQQEIQNQIPELQEVVNQNVSDETISINVLNNKINQPQGNTCDNQSNMCDNCVYKKSFYQQQNSCGCQHEHEEVQQQTSQQQAEQAPSEQPQPNKTFFEIVSPKIEELFEMHPPCEELNSLISSSKWVKVIVDESEKYYIGVIYENSQPKYIAYAVDGVYSKTPPKQLEPNAQWLPVNSLFPEGEGYWIMFQDALTGE